MVPAPREVLGQVCAEVYGRPAEQLLMLGVTGTNGKTTTAYLIEAALTAAGHRTGLVGTIETRVGDERVDSVRTTPEATELQALLAVMVERGCTACAMEVSSHALSLHRVDGVTFDVAGFTNLTQDHLDFHADQEEYFAAKASLFTPERCRQARRLRRRRVGAPAGGARRSVPVTTLLTSSARTRTFASRPDWVVGEQRPAGDGVGDRLQPGGAGRPGRAAALPAGGDFNIANTALAALMLMAVGVPVEQLRPGLATAQVPGRMERVAGPAGGPWRSSTTPTRPTPCRRPCTPCDRSPPVGWWSCSAAAATATRPSGR